MATSKHTAAKLRAHMTPGEMLRTMRKPQDMTQAALAEAAGVPQPAISAIDGGRLELGAERARRLARALHTHPAILLFPDWEAEPTKPATRRTA